MRAFQSRSGKRPLLTLLLPLYHMHVTQVVSDKMMKTVTVAVTKPFKAPKVGKYIMRTKKFMVRWATKDLARIGMDICAHAELT